MTHWCLRDLSYEDLDFLNQISLKTNKESTQADDSKLDWGSKSPKENQKRESDLCQELRGTILNRKKHFNIPHIIKQWPAEKLCLQEIILPEECDRCFTAPDELWTLMFRALSTMTSSCRLTQLDLSGFVPSSGMLYTVLQLLPVLSLNVEKRKPEILNQQVYQFYRNVNVGLLKTEGFLSNVDKFLQTLLSHRIFAATPALNIPAGHLTITLDFLPVSVDSLTFICYAVCVALSRLSLVNVIIKSFSYKYSSCGKDVLPIDPLFSLQLMTSLIKYQTLEGLSVCNTIREQTESVLEILENIPTECFDRTKFTKFMFSLNHLNLKQKPHVTKINTTLSKFPFLRRLDISGTFLDGNLSAILTNLRIGLEYLNISNSCCNTNDIIALIQSKHALTLRDVDLSHLYSVTCQICVQRRWVEGLDNRACPGPARPYSPSDANVGSTKSYASGSAKQPPELVKSENVTLWTMWNFLSQNDDGEDWSEASDMDARKTRLHSADRELIQLVISSLSNFEKAVQIEISSDYFPFRITNELFSSLTVSIANLTSLKQLTMEGYPFWDDDILGLVESIIERNSTLQSLALTRSSDAPRMKTVDRINFWKSLYSIRGDRRLRISVENFGGDDFQSLATSSNSDEGSGTLECSLTSFSD